MSEIPRDPGLYFLSTHAGQQAKHRGIGYDVVAEVIQDGEITEAHKPHQREFIKEYPHMELPVGVVVDPTDGEIITVEWVKRNK